MYELSIEEVTAVAGGELPGGCSGASSAAPLEEYSASLEERSSAVQLALRAPR
jgi:hypothetical protein